MSNEGVALVSRAGLVIFLIIMGAIFRALVGPGRKRGEIMLAGTLGGLSLGVLVASPISRLLGTETSGVCACLGMVLGWGVAWLFAKQIPREG
jgi:drug/metabolite transporter (DMT)-like permease